MTTAEMLLEAKRAYHALLTGTMARVFVDQNGERVEYTTTNRSDLKNYITELQNILTSEQNGGQSRGNGPMYLLMG